MGLVCIALTAGVPWPCQARWFVQGIGGGAAPGFIRTDKHLIGKEDRAVLPFSLRAFNFPRSPCCSGRNFPRPVGKELGIRFP